MCISKLASVAFIENKNHFLSFQLVYFVTMLFFGNGSVYFCKVVTISLVLSESCFTKWAVFFSGIYASFFQRHRILLGLIIQIFSVNHKNNFFSTFWDFFQNLTILKEVNVFPEPVVCQMKPFLSVFLPGQQFSQQHNIDKASEPSIFYSFHSKRYIW